MNMPNLNPPLPRVAVADDMQPNVRDVVRVLRGHPWPLLWITLGITLLAVIYAFLATPIYSADVLIRIDPLEPNAFGLAQEQWAGPPQQPSTDAEMAIMQSRAVIDPVLQHYQFSQKVRPHGFPILSRISAWFAKPGHPIKITPWLGLDSYAWGGEQIEIPTLTVPVQLEDKKMELIALGDGRYRLRDQDGHVLLDGMVGQLVQAGGVSIRVSKLVARPQTRFDVTGYNEMSAVKLFQRALKVSDDANDAGVVRITFDDSSPEVAMGVANGIAQNYLANSIESRQANDSRTLAFIQHELPRLRSELQQAEADLAHFESSSGSMAPATEAQSYLQGEIDFQRQIALLQIQRTQLLARFMPDSPEVHNVDQQLAQLNAYKNAFESHFSSMPESERENADLTRRARVAESVYTAMVSKAEELSVRRAGTAATAHVVDAAVSPALPVKPNRPLVIGGGLAVGLLLAVIYVYVRYQVFGGVTDPMFIERYFSVPVFATLNFSRNQAQLERSHTADWRLSEDDLTWRDNRQIVEPGLRLGGSTHLELAKPIGLAPPSLNAPPGAHRLLTRSFPYDLSIESLRTVRTALRIEMTHMSSKVVALTGPTVATGKSFVTANLGVLLAEIGMRVLLIDADMRYGRLASFFRQNNATGLADVLRGDVPVHSAIRRVGIENLSLLTCGVYPSNPSELLMQGSFKQLLNAMEQQFDVILVDTPPFLPVTDATVVAYQAGLTLLVLRAGMQNRQEIEDTVRGLDRTGARLVGAIFNGMPPHLSGHRHYSDELIARYGYEMGTERARAA